MEESSDSDKPTILAFVMLFFLIITPVSFIGFCFWTIGSSLVAKEKAPFSQATAIVTSKDSDQRLSIKSTDLPKSGDVVSVDQFSYGAVSTGDHVCVQYKSISGDPQFLTEFVGKGSCQK